MEVIHSATAEIRRGKKKRRRKKIEITGQNIMVCPITYRATKTRQSRIADFAPTP